MPTKNLPDNGKKPAVLWDLDGTLVDTNQLHWLAWEQETAHRNNPISRDQFESSFGQRNDTVLRLWFPPSITEDEIKVIGESKEDRFRQLILELGLELLPGVMAWLQEFQKNRWPQGLATMTPRINLDAIFSVLNIEAYFQAVVTGSEVSKGKPDPEVFLKTADALKVRPENCIVIEDSLAGIEAAKRAGMQTIGVNSHTQLVADISIPTLNHLDKESLFALMR